VQINLVLIPGSRAQLRCIIWREFSTNLNRASTNLNRTNWGTGGHEPVGGMLDIEGARLVLSSRIRSGRGGAVDSALVEGGHERDCSVLYKFGEGCSDSWPGSDKVCVISVSNWVQERVRSSDGLKWALKINNELVGDYAILA
jgi:hypothetical protein